MGDLIDDVIGEELSRLPTVIRGGGYKQVVVGRFVRLLEPKDILDLQEAHNKGLNGEPRSLKKVRHNHHVIAQMLASGKLDYDQVAEVSGYSLERISTLACDPTMMELIENYREARRDIAIDLGARYKAIVGLASEEVLERIEEQPEEFSSMQLVDIVERLGDRCGMGPKSSVEGKFAVGVLVTDATLDAVKGAVDAASRGRVFQGQSTASGGERTEDVQTQFSKPMELLAAKELSQVGKRSTEGVAVPETGAEETGE